MQVKFQSRGRLQLSIPQRLTPSCPLEWVGGSNSSSDHFPFIISVWAQHLQTLWAKPLFSCLEQELWMSTDNTFKPSWCLTPTSEVCSQQHSVLSLWHFSTTAMSSCEDIGYWEKHSLGAQVSPAGWPLNPGRYPRELCSLPCAFQASAALWDGAVTPTLQLMKLLLELTKAALCKGSTQALSWPWL